MSAQDKKQAKPKAPAKKVSDFPVPEYIAQRIAVWDRIASGPRESAPKEHHPIKVTLPDGSVKEGVSNQTTPLDIANAISKGLAQATVVAKVNGALWDLSRPFDGDASLELLKWDAPEAQKVFWHSSAHILGQALERVYQCHLCIGPALADGGFYYDVQIDQEGIVSSEDFDNIKLFINACVKEKQPFVRLTLTKEEALEMFAGNKYKQIIISEKVPDGEYCTAYRCGPLIDLCKGPHLVHTGKVGALKITKNSSSYWKGDAKNDLLQRVYGMSFPDKKQLAEWEEIQRKAEEMGHKNIGKKQELFYFDTDYSPGSAFFLPHGMRIYNKLMDFIRAQYRKRGFSEVISPQLYNVKLWEKSGHWQNYQKNMFSFKVEDQDWAVKPMNCPGHCLIFGSKTRSYRDLPIRYADFSPLHRNELSGALAGLTRVRKFQQDDAHIFCSVRDVQTEIANALDFLKFVYGVFGFDFTLELSTMPEEHLGDVETWENAESSLQSALQSTFGDNWKVNPGDGAFYGPKIDIHVRDALKRSFQCATIQLDFQLPERFGLSFRNEKDEDERPVIIHRAIYGSVERFFAILCEHLEGKWPFWLSPRQCIVLTVSEKFDEYAKQVHERLWDAGYYCDLDASDHTLPKKILQAQNDQYNFILVVGAKEVESNVVNVRTRDNVVHGERSVDQLLGEFADLVKNYK